MDKGDKLLRLWRSGSVELGSKQANLAEKERVWKWLFMEDANGRVRAPHFLDTIRKRSLEYARSGVPGVNAADYVFGELASCLGLESVTTCNAPLPPNAKLAVGLAARVVPPARSLPPKAEQRGGK